MAEVAIDADPLEVAAFDEVLLADEGDVVFRAAGDEAGVAAGADVEVDAHTPLFPRVGCTVGEVEGGGWPVVPGGALRS